MTDEILHCGTLGPRLAYVIMPYDPLPDELLTALDKQKPSACRICGDPVKRPHVTCCKQHAHKWNLRYKSARYHANKFKGCRK